MKDHPTSIDDLLGEAASAKPSKRAPRRRRWSWKRVKSVRVEDIPERWFWWLNAGVMILSMGLALRIAYLLIWVERPAALDTSSPAGNVPARSPVTVDMQIPSLAAASTRAMFQADAAQPATPKGPAPLSDPAKSVASRLSVLGIVTGNPSQAVIEDAQSKKTYMVAAGQTFLEGMYVEAIEPGRVIVTWQGEPIELRL